MKKETIKKVKEEAEKDFTYRLNETGDYRDTWRVFRIMSEFVEGYQFLNSLENEITILGSARFEEDKKYYKIARELGGLLAKGGRTTITGGGPGIMEAANRGAHEQDGLSIGINIQLPFEQRINPYVNKSAAFYYFFTRKVMLTAPADAFVFFPGGFGTLDEFFEVVNHIEIGKMCHVPIVLVGKEFWQPIVDFMKEKSAALDPKKLEHIDEWMLVDTAQEAYDAIAESHPLGKDACELSPLNFHKGQKNVDWKVFRIMAELVEGFEFLTGLVEDVTVLGTRHMDPGSKYYDSAYEMGSRLAHSGFAVVTGGGKGINEAANKGAMEAGGASYGIGMEVHKKVEMNAYTSKSISFKFPFTRKLIVTAPSKGFIFYPGGFGTMHHLFEVLTLIQTEKMQKVPIILFDKAYWGPLDQHIRKMLYETLHTISPEDCDMYAIVDTEEEAMEIIEQFRKKEK